MSEKPLKFFNVKPEPLTYKRECGDCNMCCKWLIYVINNHVKHPGKPCFYLGETCTVHEVRPQSCRDYFCGYIQGIVPEWMKPSLSNVLVNVEKWGPENKNMLRIIECGKKMDSEVLSWLLNFSRSSDTGIIYQLSGYNNYFGPDDFMEFFKSNIITVSDYKNPLWRDANGPA